MGDLGLIPWFLEKIPWRRKRLPTPVFWPGEFHKLYSSWGCKELDMTEQLSLHIFWIFVCYQVYHLQIFSPSLQLVYSFSNSVLHKTEDFNVRQSIISIFSFQITLWVSQLKTHCQTQDFLPYVTCRSYIVLYFTFRFMIHFGLVFVKGVSSLSISISSM